MLTYELVNPTFILHKLISSLWRGHFTTAWELCDLAVFSRQSWDFRRHSIRTASLVCAIPLQVQSLTAVCVPLRRNGNGTGRESMRVMDRVMATGKEPGIFLLKQICRRQAAKNKFENHQRVGEGVCEDIGRIFVCLDLPKISVFSTRTIQKNLTLTPHLVFWIWESFHSLTNFFFFMVIVNIRYTNIYILYVTVWLMCEYS